MKSLSKSASKTPSAYVPSSHFDQVVSDIIALRIQGASEVRKQALNALSREILKIPTSNISYFQQSVMQLTRILESARPTEPELQSPLHHIRLMVSHGKSGVKEKQSIIDFLHQFEENRSLALRKIAREGIHLFGKKAVVLTHCHSHSALEIIKLAYENNKIEHVYCTESRPLFQGRLTAKDLTDWKIPCTQIVDSAIRSLLEKQKITVFLTGADAIIPQGVINKVGTSTISMACHEKKIPHIVAASSLKFVKKIDIEERNANEVWPDRPKSLSIYNPAFDLTPKKWIRGIITENGLKR